MEYLKKLFKTSSFRKDGPTNHIGNVESGEDRARGSVHGANGEDESANMASCPPFAAKSIMGYRQGMEDTYAVVPAVVSIPEAWTLPMSSPSDRTVSINDQEDAHVTRVKDANSDSLPTQDEPVGGLCSLHLFAVYDGHGGASVSEHCSKRLHEHLRKAVGHQLHQEKEANKRDNNSKRKSHGSSPRSSAGTADVDDNREPEKAEEGIRAALIDTFLNIDKELFKKGSAKDKGTTAIVALLGQRHVWAANCGDSRAVVARGHHVITLSSDHKANRPDEMARVEQAGGYVWWNRVQGELAISRAIGDHKLRPYVIAEPEVMRMERHADDKLLILASDGMWDVLGNAEVCRIALAKFESELAEGGSVRGSLKKVAALLAKTALERGSRDNVTVLIVDLRQS